MFSFQEIFEGLMLVVFVLLQLSAIFILYVKFLAIGKAIEDRVNEVTKGSSNFDYSNDIPVETIDLTQNNSETGSQNLAAVPKSAAAPPEAAKDNNLSKIGDSKRAEPQTNGNPDLSSSLIQNLIKAK